MQPALTQADRMRSALEHYRRHLSAGADLADERLALEAIEPTDTRDGTSMADYYELLAYDALSLSQPGYAFACLESAATLVSSARREGLQRLAQGLLDAHFPPFETQADVTDAVRTWARSALAARSLDDDSARGHATRLRQGWMFRLVNAQRKNRSFRIDALLDTFRLSAKERTLFRILHAVHWDQQVDRTVGSGGLTVGDLLDLVADTHAERPEWLACLDGRSPLIASRLVRLGPPGAMRRRTIDLDESTVAWVESRTWVSPELGTSVARHQRLEFDTPDYLAPCVQAIDRAVSRSPRSRTALVARSAASHLVAMQAWAAATDRPVFQLRASLPAEDLRALAREVRLQNGILTLPSWLASHAAALHAAVYAPVIFEAHPGQLPSQIADLHDLARVSVPTPAVGERPALWNQALIDAGLPELDPEALAAAIGPYDLDLAEIGLVTSSLVASGITPAQTNVPRVAAAAAQWLSERTG